jgi:hypothetical protein
VASDTEDDEKSRRKARDDVCLLFSYHTILNDILYKKVTFQTHCKFHAVVM